MTYSCYTAVSEKLKKKIRSREKSGISLFKMRSKGFDRLKYAGCEAGKSLLNIQTSAMLKEPLHKRRGG